MAIDAKKTPLGTVCIQRTPVEPFVKKGKIIIFKTTLQERWLFVFRKNIYIYIYKENDTPVLSTSWLQLKWIHLWPSPENHQLLEIEKLHPWSHQEATWNKQLLKAQGLFQNNWAGPFILKKNFSRSHPTTETRDERCSFPAFANSTATEFFHI